jgi:endonuclease/exonuclease/phosphatase family metal-dependent hydrolase
MFTHSKLTVNTMLATISLSQRETCLLAGFSHEELSMLQIMSFNIRGAQHPDGTNAWPARADLNLRIIRNYAPHVIGFQECQRENLEVYAQALPEYSYAAGEQSASNDRQHNAIFWRTSEIQMLGLGQFWLSETPEVAFSQSWDSCFARTVLWTRLRLGEDGQVFIFVNTHLDHRGETARVEGCKLIARKLNQDHQTDLPIILAGDFNCIPNSPAYTALRAAGFRDTFEMASAEDQQNPHTFHDFGKLFTPASKVPDSVHKAGLRIDWILLKDDQVRLRPVSCSIIRDAEPPVYPSDHYPVLSTFEF